MPQKEADNFRPQLAGDKPGSSTAAPRRKGDGRFAGLFRRKREPVPFTAREPDRRGDLTVAALGVTLGLICALFPWYIFYNPDQFGIRAMKFRGSGAQQTEPVTLGAQPERIGAPSMTATPPAQLDLLPTGTARNDKTGSPEFAAAALADQPFPAETPRFHLLHIENGRAMIEDDAGIFIVEPGSVLPDRSRVEAIVERDGALVLITSDERVLEVAK